MIYFAVLCVMIIKHLYSNTVVGLRIFTPGIGHQVGEWRRYFGRTHDYYYVVP